MAHGKPEENQPPKDPSHGEGTHQVSAPLDPARTDLYVMISRMPVEQLETARRFLRFLIADANRSEEAALDYEPLTAEDLQAIREARSAVARGDFVTLDELEQRHGGEDSKHG